MPIRSYQDLEVWKKAVKLVGEAFKLAEMLPKSQQYVLVKQIHASALSVPANIAEGRGRSSRNEFIYFLKIATGSLAEVESHFFVAIELQFITSEQSSTFFQKSAEVGRMLNGLIESLRKQKQKIELPQMEPET